MIIHNVFCAHCRRDVAVPAIPDSSDRRTLMDLAARGKTPFVTGLSELVDIPPESVGAVFDHLTVQRGTCHACAGDISWSDLITCPTCAAINVQWKHREPELPCPACGFVTIEGFYGSYSLCPVCGWEDDGVQLANPTSAGGANQHSLAEAQRAALQRWPVSILTHGVFNRFNRWRPLELAEIASAEERRKVQHWHTPAVVEAEEAYWNLPAV